MLKKLATMLGLLSASILLVSCVIGRPSATPMSFVSSWSIYRHESLGVEVQYPTGWQVDSTHAFVWFCDIPQAKECFNIVNASFGVKQPTDFLAHIGVPVEMTRTLNLDGQPALFVEFKAAPESEGYVSMVGVITPYRRELTIGNRTDREIFKQVLSTIKFFKPSS